MKLKHIVGYNNYIIIFVIIFIIYIIYRLVKLYINYKKLQISLKISSHNNLFCKKFERPCDIVINNNLNIPANINNKYDIKIAKLCIDLISRIIAIYLPPKIGNLYIHPKMTLLETLIYPDEQYPVMGYISKDDNNNMWIVFRGSLDKIDITQDLIYKQTDLINSSTNKSKIMCHQGFINVYNTFKKQIFVSVNKYNPNKIILTGHSLGAGIATVTAYHLGLINRNVYVYTFASPKVGNIEFADEMNKISKCFFRIVNLSDLIPTLPIAVMPNMKDKNNPFIYMHTGKMIFFDQNWKSIENNHMIYNYRTYIDSLL